MKDFVRFYFKILQDFCPKGIEKRSPSGGRKKKNHYICKKYINEKTSLAHNPSDSCSECHFAIYFPRIRRDAALAFYTSAAHRHCDSSFGERSDIVAVFRHPERHFHHGLVFRSRSRQGTWRRTVTHCRHLRRWRIVRI